MRQRTQSPDFDKDNFTDQIGTDYNKNTLEITLSQRVFNPGYVEKIFSIALPSNLRNNESGRLASSAEEIPDLNGDNTPDFLANVSYTRFGAYATRSDSASFLIYGKFGLRLADAADGNADGMIAYESLSVTFDDAAAMSGAFHGTADADRIAVIARSKSVFAGSGDDLVVAIEANATADLGAGNDRFIANGGSQRVLGREGDDIIRTSFANDSIDGGSGDDRIDAGAGDDRILGGGGFGADIIRADVGDDSVNGGAGDDVVFGWRGDDSLEGGAGNDYLSGGFDADTISGGAGDDRLFGGAGRDVFVFRRGFGEDRILDFYGPSDVLDFSDHPSVARITDLTIRAVRSAVVIDDRIGGRIVLADTTLQDLDGRDFLF